MKRLPSGPRKTQYLGGTNGRARASSTFAMRSNDCEIVLRLRQTVSCRSDCSRRKSRRLFRIEARTVSLGKCNGWSGIAALPYLSRRERDWSLSHRRLGQSRSRWWMITYITYPGSTDVIAANVVKLPELGHLLCLLLGVKRTSA